MTTCHAGVVRDPLVGYQAGGAAGLALGVIIGGTGLVLKPTSGLLECISKGVNGLGMGILAWGDEVVRIPRTRIRSPRHFGMFAADPTGGQSLLACINCLHVALPLLHVSALHMASKVTSPILTLLTGTPDRCIVVKP